MDAGASLFDVLLVSVLLVFVVALSLFSPQEKNRKDIMTKANNGADLIAVNF